MRFINVLGLGMLGIAIIAMSIPIAYFRVDVVSRAGSVVSTVRFSRGTVEGSLALTEMTGSEAGSLSSSAPYMVCWMYSEKSLCQRLFEWMSERRSEHSVDSSFVVFRTHSHSGFCAKFGKRKSYFAVYTVNLQQAVRALVRADYDDSIEQVFPPQ